MGSQHFIFHIVSDNGRDRTQDLSNTTVDKITTRPPELAC
jgi:hypothetical protein